MKESNPDLGNEVDRLLKASAFSFAEAAFKMISAEAAKSGASKVPSEFILKEIHRHLTSLVLKSAGAYRTGHSYPFVVDSTRKRTYKAPAGRDVENLIRQFIDDLVKIWDASSASYVAGFAFWRIGSIHPFDDGNGRAAKVFAYLCLCLKLDLWLPGNRDFISLIADGREEYTEYFYAANGSDEAIPDLSSLANFLRRSLMQQLSEYPETLGAVIDRL